MRTMQLSRRVTNEHVAAADIPAIPAKTTKRPPCADGPDSWDLDTGTPETWRAAVQTCFNCPLFAQCGQLARTLIDRGDNPRAMIWAGVAYDNSGNVIENLDRHRTMPTDHKPLRIIRNGSRPRHSEPMPHAPRRQIILGRKHRATGASAEGMCV